MIDKRELLKKSWIYCVLDAQVAEYDQLFDILDCSADAGVDIFQIRDKYGSARQIIEFTRKAMKRLNGEKLFIVNDRVDLAVFSGADGVHVGQDDLDIADVRSFVDKDFIVGTSCQTLEQALKAQQEADYIGFGSIFKTQTKPDRSPMDLTVLKNVLEKISIPIFPIGGITVDNVGIVKECGANRVAITRAVCLADDVVGMVQELRDKLINS